MKKIILVFLIFAGLSAEITALNVVPDDAALALANAFVAPGTGITVESASINYNMSWTGGQYMTGIYTGGPMGIGNGIILSTGRSIDALPPDDDPQKSGLMGLPGNSIVNEIVGNFVESHDTVILTVVFSADITVNSVTFDFIFGSEEYPTYVGSDFNDTFGVFINGTSSASQVVFDSTGWPIMINGPFFSSSNVKVPPENGMQFNGSTAVLTTRASVGPGTTGNVMRIVISDVGDAALDSGVLLSGFRGIPDIITTPITGKSSPTFTATESPTWTTTETHTITPTHSVSPTITETWTITETHTITPTHTATPTFTATPTRTPTPVIFILEHKGSFPSPFTDTTQIVYWLSREAVVDIKFYTVSGETVRHDAGINAAKFHNTFAWDGKNSGGLDVASGVFLYRIHAVSPLGEEAEAWGKTARVK